MASENSTKALLLRCRRKSAGCPGLLPTCANCRNRTGEAWSIGASRLNSVGSSAMFWRKSKKRIAARGLTLTFGSAERELAVLGDAGRLEQLLSNLIENSLRYTDAPGTLSVSIEVSGDSVCLTVADSAPGVPDEALPHLFERLYRGRRVPQPRHGRLGPGIVDLQSDRYGPRWANRGGSLRVRGPRDFGSAAVDATRKCSIVTRQQRVIIVEDEAKIAELLRDYLEQSSFDVDWVDNGYDAVHAVRESGPDIVLLDLMLPGKDGLSICREIRGFSDVPIIIVTAKVEEIDRLLGLELGADDYVCKPFSPPRGSRTGQDHTATRRRSCGRSRFLSWSDD